MTDHDHAQLATDLRRLAEATKGNADYFRRLSISGLIPVAENSERDAATLLAAASAIEELKKACDLHCITQEVNMCSIREVRRQLADCCQQAAAAHKELEAARQQHAADERAIAYLDTELAKALLRIEELETKP